MQKYKVMKNRMSDVEHPIVVKRDQAVKIIEESDPQGDWPGWIYCRTEVDEGWIPHQIIKRDGLIGHILKDYSALEWDIEFGEILVAIEKLNGWIWCYKESDESKMAWAPLNHLKEVV